MLAVYEALCPSCGGDIDSHRLSMGLPCRSCLGIISHGLDMIEDPFERAKAILGIIGKGGDYGSIISQEEDLEAFSSFFERVVGHGVWSIQRAWARRLLKGSSLVLTAPTGSGKSTLVQAYSLYMASKGYPVYFIVPTRELLRQSVERISSMASRSSVGVRIAYYDSSARKDLREKALEIIRSGEYDLLATTSSMFTKISGILSEKRFDVIVADDLDSLIKSSKNLEGILSLVGVSREEIDLALKIASKKYEVALARASKDPGELEKHREEIEVLKAELALSLSRKRLGQLVVSTATGKSWGLRSKILREILGFEVGGILEYMRNIVDAYTNAGKDDIDALEDLLKNLGPGTIIYFSRGYDDEKISEIVSELIQRNLRIGIYKPGGKGLRRFLEGELDFIAGKASFYGSLVRGLDEPLRIRNAVFIGIPKHVIPLKSYLADLRSLALFYKSVDSQDTYREIYRLLRRLPPTLPPVIKKILKNHAEASESLRETIDLIRGWISDAIPIARQRCGEGIELGGSLIMCPGNGEPVVVIPDAMTYIQASGRTSRLLGGNMTLGLSIVIPESLELLSLLYNRLKRYIPELVFREYGELDLEGIKREQERSRSPGSMSGQPLSAKSILMIVESPTKARTIARLFGSRSRRLIGPYSLYEFSFRKDDSLYMVSVIATMGHVFDLSTEGGVYGLIPEAGILVPRYGFIRRCLSCGTQYTDPVEVCRRCGSTRIRSSEDLLKILRRVSSEYDEILIATDPDMEGEKIAWDLYLTLKPYSKRILRAEFHEITRGSVLQAIVSPRTISRSMVDAQIVRRIDDRVTGFSISQELQERFSMRWLGAGRVETPALSWVVERYNQYRSSMGYKLLLELSGYRVQVFFERREDAEAALKSALDSGVKILGLAREKRILRPPPPYVTDSLIYDASAKLGLPASLIMRAAQDLFEMGLITYHRTDSTRISQRGFEIAREYLSKKDLADLFDPRSWGEGGAHEAIRPTQPMDLEDLERAYLEGEIPWGDLSWIHTRVYDLIFRRFIASQMSETEAEICTASLEVGGKSFSVEGLCSEARGFNQIYQVVRKLPEDLLKRSSGEYVAVSSAKISRGSLVKLITGGELVKIMKEKGVGRPSTYAKAIESNKRHGYVVESKRGYLIPTKLGITIIDYIRQKHPSIASEEHTRRLMEQVESIERGERNAEEVLREILERYAREDQRIARIMSIDTEAGTH
ncbi:MAG TPA: reverse gyrase [Sulfolobales archaeon]|nr:reverse gyrase [Sulfolobales archaeon]